MRFGDVDLGMQGSSMWVYSFLLVARRQLCGFFFKNRLSLAASITQPPVKMNYRCLSV